MSPPYLVIPVVCAPSCTRGLLFLTDVVHIHDVRYNREQGEAVVCAQPRSSGILLN